MNISWRNDENREVLRLCKRLSPGDVLKFDEGYIHEIYGDPLTEKEVAIRRVTGMVVMDAIRQGDISGANDTAEEYADPCIRGKTSIRDFVDTFRYGVTVDKRNCIVEIRY